MHPSRLACLTLSLTLTLSALPATADDARGPPDISLEDLLGVEVTGASRKGEHLHEVAAAVLVISREDFERSGATSIPQALRLAPGVKVASLANNRFGNKLLVPMDKRSIYSPLFSGVLWEYEDTLLEDIDRIEVIRGPSAAMWGANAVIGVINIITRRARDTQGKLLVAGAGSEERLFGPFSPWWADQRRPFPRLEQVVQARRGGRHVWPQRQRLFARRARRLSPRLEAGRQSSAAAEWGQADTVPTGDAWTFLDPASKPGFTLSKGRQDGKGGHLLGRSEWALADGFDAALQAYVEHKSIDLQGAFSGQRTTADVDVQYRRLLAERYDLIWGLGYRYSSDRIGSRGDFLTILPDARTFRLASAFAYDDITLLPDALRLMLGLRRENSRFGGCEPLPNVRLMSTPNPRQTFSGSMSRGARIASRSELDAQIELSVLPAGAPGNPTPLPIVTRSISTGDLPPETVIAYDIGFRQRLSSGLSLHVTAFYNRYDDVRSASLRDRRLTFTPAPAIVQSIVPDNSIEAHTHGFEIAVDGNPLS